MERENRALRILFSVMELALLAAIIVGIPLYVYFFRHEWIDYFSSIDNINSFLEEHKAESMGIYFVMQVLQVVISVIPGQALQFVAGYAFPIWLGYLLAITGVALGTIISYFLARLLGRKALYTIIGRKRLDKFVNKLNTKKAHIIVFVMFLIPGLPKDLFSYGIGISEMKFKSFLIISLVARTPAMLGSIAMGVSARTGNYAALIVLIIAVVVACICGFLWYEKLIEKLEKALM